MLPGCDFRQILMVGGFIVPILRSHGSGNRYVRLIPVFIVHLLELRGIGSIFGGGRDSGCPALEGIGLTLCGRGQCRSRVGRCGIVFHLCLLDQCPVIVQPCDRDGFRISRVFVPGQYRVSQGIPGILCFRSKGPGSAYGHVSRRHGVFSA